MKKKIAYICTGVCQAQITQEQFNSGLRRCGAKDCDMYNKPFKAVHKPKKHTSHTK